MREIRPGDVLVVVRLDRLARSVSHLLAVIEQLEANGAHFRSLRDPIDTTTPQGMFSLQVLGAVAQLERALIAERTKAGLRAARSRGRVGGNPGLRAGDPDAIRKVRASRDAAHLDSVLAQLDTWLPTVRRIQARRLALVRTLGPGHTSAAWPGVRPAAAWRIMSSPAFSRSRSRPSRRNPGSMRGAVCGSEEASVTVPLLSGATAEVTRAYPLGGGWCPAGATGSRIGNRCRSG